MQRDERALAVDREKLGPLDRWDRSEPVANREPGLEIAGRHRDGERAGLLIIDDICLLPRFLDLSGGAGNGTGEKIRIALAGIGREARGPALLPARRAWNKARAADARGLAGAPVADRRARHQHVVMAV